MGETVLDVLLYLFDTFVDADEPEEPSRDQLRMDLMHVGFRHREIDGALRWIEGLHTKSEQIVGEAPLAATVRVFDAHEQSRLDTESRGYILRLEQMGILAPAQRELLIDRLLALNGADLDVEQIQWVALMVLFSQPDQADAFTRMQELVFADGSAMVH